MKIICKEDLNLIIKLPQEREVIVGKLKFESREINLSKRISNLYMKNIGFTPYEKDGKYYHYKAEVRHNGVYVSHYRSEGNCASVSNTIQIDDLDFMNLKTLLDGFTFLLSNKTEESVFISKYMIVEVEDDVLEVKKIDELVLYSKDKNLSILRNAKECMLEDTMDFFENIDFGEELIFEPIIAFIFNSFVDEKGFLDIYKTYHSFLTRIPYLSFYDRFRYYYYIGQLDYFYLSEYLIKNDFEDRLSKENPVYTKQPIKQVESIPLLSKFSKQMKQEYHFDDNDIEILFEMEAHERIGKEGIKIIYDYFQAIDKINSTWESPFRAWRKYDLCVSIYNIIDTFDITPKNLMNRFVRAMFYEHININDYARLINDTIEMANILDIELDKKLPKEIIKIHDLLKDQIRYIRNKEVEEAFNKVMLSNNKLLEKLPKSDEFMVISPSTPNDLVNEGLMLNHCVGSYIDRYATGYSKIFFVRRKGYETEPFVTLELDRNNRFVQISGFSNKRPSKDVMDYVNNWLENIDK